MKLAAGIPTRERTSAWKVINSLMQDNIIEYMCLIPQGTKIDHPKINKTYEMPVDPVNGLRNARNMINEICLAQNSQYILQADDDITVKPGTIAKMVEILDENPLVGGIVSIPRIYLFWAKDREQTKPFVPITYTAQLSILRASVVREMGEYALSVCEDLEMGLRMWSRGIPLVQLHAGKEFYHNSFKARTSKVEGEGGGIPPSELFTGMETGRDYIMKRYSNGISSFVANPKPGKYMSIKYNWDGLLAPCRERYNGAVGYSDNIGRWF